MSRIIIEVLNAIFYFDLFREISPQKNPLYLCTSTPSHTETNRSTFGISDNRIITLPLIQFISLLQSIAMSSSDHKKPSKTSSDSGKDGKSDSSSIADAMTAMSNKKPEAMEAIEEDDEFEEFQEANWGASGEDAEDTQQWQDNWDIDDMDDDFTQNLREELKKNNQ